MNPDTPTPNATGTPFNGGAPLTPDQIQSMRSQAGIDTNPATAINQINPQDQLAALKAGTFGQVAHGTSPTTNEGSSQAISSAAGFNAPDLQTPGQDIMKGVQTAANNAVTNEEKGTLGGELEAAGNLAEGGLATAGGVAKGAGNILGSMIPQGLKDWLFQGRPEGGTTNSDGSKNTTDVTQAITDKIGQLAQAHPQAATDIGNLGAILGLALGNEGEPAVAKAGENAVTNTAKAVEGQPGKAFRGAFTPLPPAIKNTVATAPDAEAATNFIKEAQNVSKEAQKGTGAITHPQMVGEQLFGDQGRATTTLTEAKKAAGEKMGTALKTPGVGDAPVDVTKAITTHQPLFEKAIKVGNLSGADSRTAANFKNALYEIQKPQPLTTVDNFLREWQGVTTQDPTLNKAITNTVHDINETAKSTADAAEETAGITGHPYRESNDEYRNVITPLNAIKDIQKGGYKSALTGANSANSALMDQLTSQGGQAKGLMDDVRALVGKKGNVGGLTMNDQAQISQLIHDLYTGVDPKTAFSKMSVSISPVMSGIRTAIRTLGANATSPDAIVQKMLDVLAKNK